MSLMGSSTHSGEKNSIKSVQRCAELQRGFNGGVKAVKQTFHHILKKEESVWGARQTDFKVFAN